MKKLILAFAIMVSIASFAQERESRAQFRSEQDIEVYLKKMTADLNLSDKQQAEVKLIFTDQFNKRMELRAEMKRENENGLEISDEKRAEMKKQRADEQLEMKTKMKKILSEEQMKKFEASRKENSGDINERKPIPKD